MNAPRTGFLYDGLQLTGEESEFDDMGNVAAELHAIRSFIDDVYQAYGAGACIDISRRVDLMVEIWDNDDYSSPHGYSAALNSAGHGWYADIDDPFNGHCYDVDFRSRTVCVLNAFKQHGMAGSDDYVGFKNAVHLEGVPVYKHSKFCVKSQGIPLNYAG